jgi:hypothetical protein
MDNEYIDTTDNTIDFGSSSESIEGGSNPPGKSDAGMTDKNIRADIAERMEYMIYGNEFFNNYIKEYTIGTPNGDMIQKYKSMIKKPEIKECINIFKQGGYDRRCAKILNDILKVSEPIRKIIEKENINYNYPPHDIRFKRKYTEHTKNFIQNYVTKQLQTKKPIKTAKPAQITQQGKKSTRKHFRKIFTRKNENIRLGIPPESETKYENIPVGTPLGEIGEEVDEEVVDEDEDQNGGSSSEENTLEDYDKYDLMYNRNKAYYLALKSV